MKMIEKKAMVAVSNKKHERLKKYKKYAVGDDIASEYSRIVRPIDDTTMHNCCLRDMFIS